MPEEVSQLSLFRVNEPNIRFMHERRGLQRLVRFLLGHLGSGQLPQLFINQRQQLLGGRRIAGFNLAENACDVAHGPGSPQRNCGIACLPGVFACSYVDPPGFTRQPHFGRYAGGQFDR